jgi:hypothetical protein
VAVKTTENGKQVTKYMRESQIAGQSFESPQEARRPIGAERTALGFYNRAKEADHTITASGYEERFAKANLLEQAQGNAWNVLQTDEQRQYRQAQRAFTEARLRKESGAAVPAAEYTNDERTYFAVPGDDAATIAQKRKMRQDVLDGIGFQAGPAYEEFYGVPFKKGGSAAGSADADGWITLPDGTQIRQKK